MYYVYVQRNLKGKCYKGFTSNITRRRIEHLLQRSNYSKRLGPSELVYCTAFKSKKEALEKERFLKSGKGREFLKSILE